MITASSRTHELTTPSFWLTVLFKPSTTTIASIKKYIITHHIITVSRQLVRQYLVVTRDRAAASSLDEACGIRVYYARVFQLIQ